MLAEASKRKVDTEVVTLEVGDFVWDESICIERKNVPDYIHSVRDGRLFSQATDMGQYSSGYVVIVGSFKGIASSPHLKNFTVAHKLGSMASLLARTSIKILHVDNQAQFVHSVFILKDKSDKGEKTECLERHSKTVNRHDPNFALFLSIPGVGPSIAKNIMKEYSSFYELIYDVRKGNELLANIPKEGIIYLKKACGIE